MCPRRVLALAVLALCLRGVPAPAQDAGGRSEDATIRTRCLTCHGVDLIDQQRLTRAGWERELDKMIRWGAVVPDTARAPLLDALQQRSDARASSRQADVPATRGRMVFEQRCLRCHRADIVEQQRLSPAGWRRELDKMIAWGARVDSEDREPLLEYLSERHPSR